MAITSDNFIERALLRKKLSYWRIFSVIAIILFLLSLVEKNVHITKENYIARISFNDVIEDDHKLYKLLDDVAKDKSIKAVILEMDTPGGVAVAGETIFNKIMAIKKQKPVVVSMRGVCASAGYMIALAADRIFAMNGTITGSIGVILQAAEFSKLADKIGVTPITIKSGELKGNPSIAEPITDKSREVLQQMVDEFHLSFVKMVAENRHIDEDKVKIIADGRVYSSNKALELKLIDEIGDEENAIKWLQENKDISADLEVKDAKIKKDFDQSFAEITGLANFNFMKSGNDNILMLMWQP
jgi:protease-4